MHTNKRRRLHVEFLEHRRLLHGGTEPLDAAIMDGEVRIQADIAGNTFGRARDLGTLTADRSFVDRVGNADKADVFRFHVDRATTLTSTLSGLSADIDMYFFNDAGREIARDPKTGARVESVALTLSQGDYFVLIIPRGSAESSYRLLLDVAAGSVPANNQPASNPPASNPQRVVSSDAGNTFGRATNIGQLNGQVSRSERVGGEDKADVVKFNLASHSTVVVKLHGLSANADVFVFDLSGDLIARDYQDGRTPETLSRQLSAGSYYVLVLPHGNVTANYTLSIASVTAQAPQHLPAPTPAPTPTPTPQPHTNLPVPLRDVKYFGGANQWNVNLVRAPEVWNAGFTGQGIVIAVLDTGVDRNHSDLAANIWRNWGDRPGDGIDNDQNGFVDDAYGWNFSNNSKNTFDPNGHGTHVAGIAASRRNGTGTTGIAYNAKIMPVRVLNANGYGRTSHVAKGIRYAVDNGADIINLSFLGSYSPEIYSALRYAFSKNVLVAIAAGNNNGAQPSFPARHSNQFPNVISVGSHNSSNARSSFSNHVGDSGAVQVDAPGQQVYSTVPGNRYAHYTGTSMAAPHVSGLAALALSANPQLTTTQLRNLIVQGANRRIARSDGRGGINGARTVPMAHNGVGLAAVAASREVDQEGGHIDDLRLVVDESQKQVAAASIEADLSLSSYESRESELRELADNDQRVKKSPLVVGGLLPSEVDAAFQVI